MILPPTDSVVDVSHAYGGLEGLQIQLSKAVITNCHIGDSGCRSRSHLQPVIRSLGTSCVTWDGRGPVDFSAPHGTAYVTKLLQKHADGDDLMTVPTAIHTDHVGKPTSLLTDGFSANRFQRSAANDIWFADVDQLWLEFVVAGDGGTLERASRRRTVPLVDNFPLMAWMSRSAASMETSSSKTAVDSVVQAPKDCFCLITRLGTKDIKAQVYIP